MTLPAKKESAAELEKRSRVLVERLGRAYPGATCALTHENPLQLLVATILSAQCTDARVNKVTPALFARYPTASDLAQSDRSELEELVRTTGFYRNKAKSIHGAASKLAEEFDGEVPRTMEELLTLPGVARKTANVVLGTAFRIASGFVVDTHVFRLSHRLGLAKGKTPVEVEKEMMALIPEKHWIDFGHILIHHGRAVCSARAPRCDDCVVASHCPKIGVQATAAEPGKAPRRTGKPLAARIAASKKKKTKAK